MNNRIFVSLLASLLLLTGCLSNNSQPASYYVLTADERLQPLSGDTPADIAIEIAALQLPQYLERKQIVTRSSANQLHFSESNRWGGNLRKNINSVLAGNLSLLLNSNRVVVIPHTLPLRKGYRLEMVLRRFERDHQGHIILSVQWRMFSIDSMQAVDDGEERMVSAPLKDNEDYPAIVAAMSASLSDFSRLLAQRISADVKSL